MAITAAQVTVAATATALNTANATNWTTLVIRNSHASDALFLGPSTVTIANGASLGAGQLVTLSIAPGDVLYGIRDANAITAHVLRVSG
jgi:hypothetical protein